MAGSRSMALLIAAAAALGVVVSVYNYLSPDSGIAATPGAILVIASSAIIGVFGLIMRNYGGCHRALRVFVIVSCLIGICGTALAAHLLESQALLGLMVVALIGWLMHVVTPQRAAA